MQAKLKVGDAVQIPETSIDYFRNKIFIIEKIIDGEFEAKSPENIGITGFTTGRTIAHGPWVKIGGGK